MLTTQLPYRKYKRTSTDLLALQISDWLKPTSETDPVMEWREWLETIYPRYVFAPFAERHIEFWEWVERIRQGVKKPALVAIWARGGAKSSSAELAVARLGARRAVNYVWYCCETQDQAVKHVETISALLENERLAQFHPMLAERALSKYGSSKGWRHNRLHTASGLTVDSIGLDTAVRGSKTEQNRPDLIILDDVDNKLDSLDRVKRKINVLTTGTFCRPARQTAITCLFKTWYNRSGQMSGVQWGLDIVGIDQNLPRHTSGACAAASTPVISGAGQTGSSITTSGWGTASAPVAGDIVTFAGVYSVNPISKVSTGRLQQFVLTATPTAGTSITLSISPSIVTSGALQNVSGPPADNATVTYWAMAAGGTQAATISPQSLIFHPHALAAVMADLAQPNGGAKWSFVRSKQLGISIRYVEQFDE